MNRDVGAVILVLVGSSVLRIAGDGTYLRYVKESLHPWLMASGVLLVVLGLLALAGLAVLLSICSEADAFVAASLGQFSLTARLAFLVVGPMVDIKLVALQTGTFGRAFSSRFAPTTFVVAVVVASLVGWWLL